MVQINNIFSRSFETPLPIIFIPFILYFTSRDVASFGGEKGEEEEKKTPRLYFYAETQQCEQRGNIDIVAIRSCIYSRLYKIGGNGNTIDNFISTASYRSALLYRRIIKIRVHCTQGY